MKRTAPVDERSELESIIRDGRALADETGNPRDAELARLVEAEARELLARLPAPSTKRNKSNAANKRNAFKRCIRLDADAPILAQVRVTRAF